MAQTNTPTMNPADARNAAAYQWLETALTTWRAQPKDKRGPAPTWDDALKATATAPTSTPAATPAPAPSQAGK